MIENIQTITNEFKEKSLLYEENPETELIKSCLNYNHNHDLSMIKHLNLVTYAEPQYNINNLE